MDGLDLLLLEEMSESPEYMRGAQEVLDPEQVRNSKVAANDSTGSSSER